MVQGLPSVAQTAQWTADEIVQRMLETDSVRRQALQRYTSSRVYVAENKRFSQRAEVAVRESYSFPGKKDFTVLSETGSGYIRRKVIDKLIAAEIESAQKDNRDQTRITPENYRFQLSGTEPVEGRSCFVVEVIPLHAKKYLVRGKIWVDQEEFAIMRMEVAPAKNPSFWTRKVQIVRRYQKYGLFWLPASLESASDILIAGKSTLQIAYTDYQINSPDNQPGLPAPVADPALRAR
ncbi:MAG: outer membrane lipoprotein-sorting protein [Acidobacteriota bacterium]|nr:outer membrane lipoprotein-sorting protein [Acidobacteriota bacterium]